jgi:IS5 family transposase
MSLPDFSTQAELFSTAGLSASLFAQTDRYRLFAKLVYPPLAAARAALEKCYCAQNGRVALEPVLMLGTSLLQFLDGVPDRQAVEMLRYHAGWNFALNRQLGDEVFHPSSLVNFRNRLEEHQQSALGFTIILEALAQAGLVSRQSRQRLDSTQIFGRVARMSRLDCMRETLRLALQELEGALTPETRPNFWLGLWERYVESQTDYRAGSETLARKLAESGTDAWQLLEWLRQPEHGALAAGEQAQLLARVFAEQFEIRAGQAVAAPKETLPLAANRTPAVSEGLEAAAPTSVEAPAHQTQAQAQTQAQTSPAKAAPETQAPAVAEAAQVAPVAPQGTAAPTRGGSLTGQPGEAPTQAPVMGSGATIQPKDKQQLASDRVQNPHEPEATYAAKGRGEHKKEHVGYKVQVAETVCEVELAPGEPTRNFITGMVTHPAYEHDEAGALKMEAEQAAMGLDKPPVQYVDSAYISAHKLVQARAEGRELIGPALPGPQKEDRFRVSDFHINLEQRTATCPAGKVSTQCSRLVEQSTGKVNYRIEFSTQCHECPLRAQCLGKDQRHRTILVGEHYTALQDRRAEQQTPAFKQRMKHRNAIEGTQSELVRGHGLRRARYRGLLKVKLQNYFIGAACNVKRWLRREAWNLQQAARLSAQAGALANH